jgi:membrane carboxypeptidase/penicillin-binding protein
MRDHGRIDPQEDFDVPAGIVFTPVDYDTGLKATADTPIPVLEAFLSGSQPTEEWTARSQEIAKLPWSMQEPFYVPKKGELPESSDIASSPPATAPPKAP